MAELAVQAASVLVETAIIFVHGKFKQSSTDNVEDDVKKAKFCLESLRACQSDYYSSSSSSSSSSSLSEQTMSLGLQTRVKQVRDIAYEIEDALDMFMLQVPHQFHSNSISQKLHDGARLPTVWKARREFSSQINNILDKKIDFLKKLDKIHQNPARCQESRQSSSVSSRRGESGDNYLSHLHRVLEEEEMVGFEEPKQKLLKQLVTGDNSTPLTIISIEGPGGSGKTTLLKIVFENKRVQQFFDCHAWIDVPRDLSSDRKLNELLLKMLGKLDPKGKRQEPDRREDPKEQLRILLLRKRFVVVLDNVWSRQDLECIVNALPNGLPGSKIIITTRDSSIATGHAKPSYIHNLSKVLSPTNAWNLFSKKAFPDSGGQCPFQLLQLARNIVDKCEGLPLAISTVGTLLATKEQTPREWKTLHDSLVSNLPIISRVLEQSYRDLPDHLKTCFLYFSMFPEGYSISRARLIRLWVAEGFVEQTTSEKSVLEEVAEGYLKELVERNLVQETSREIDDGRAGSCRVLNLVLEFIISKVENFITVSCQTNSSGSTQGEKIRRLSVHNASMINLSRGRDLSCIRTLQVCGLASSNSELERKIETFRFLKVLDLQGVPLEDFPNSVVGLGLLRYLSLRETNVKTVPKSIKKLGFLQTLDLKQTQVTTLPAEIYALQNLRHLLVYRYDVTNYVTFGAARGAEVSAGSIAALTSIQKLSLIKVKNVKIVRALGELTGLRKLGLVDLERKDGWELCCSVQKMKSLSTFDVRSTSEEEYLDLDHIQQEDQMQSPPCFLNLRRLYLKGRLKKLPQWIPLLHSVAKIGLKWSKLSANENPLTALQALSNLKELDLVHYYTGEKLEFKDGTFAKLKILCIDQFDQLNTVIVEKGAMPNLKNLTMSRCQNLELPPLGIQFLKSLDELLLYDMNKELIAKLQKGSQSSDYRQMVEHIRVIHSFSLGSNHSFSGFQNLS